MQRTTSKIWPARNCSSLGLTRASLPLFLHLCPHFGHLQSLDYDKTGRLCWSKPISKSQLTLESRLTTGARRVKTPEEVTLELAALFCLYSAEKGDRSEKGGVSLAGNHSVWSWGKFSKISPPSWHSSGLKEAPGQKWPKTGANCLNVARRRHLLPGPTLFCPHLTSWF